MNARTRPVAAKSAELVPQQQPQPQVINVGGQPQSVDVNAVMRQMRAQQTVTSRKISQLTEESMNKEIELEIIRVDIKNANERADVINIRNIVLNNMLAFMLETGVITDEQFQNALADADKSMRHFNNDQNVIRIMESNIQHVSSNISTFRQEHAARTATEKGGKGANN